MKKLSDLDKTLRVRQLGGKTVKLTVSHVGIKREKKKSEVLILVGGDLPEEYEETVFLYWKEHGTRFPLVLNATNREFVIKHIGDVEDWAKRLIGCKLTLERAVHPAFKKEYVGISAIESPKAAKGEAVNTDTGEIVDRKDRATEFWGIADAAKMKTEASKILERHTTSGVAGKSIDWASAIAELKEVAAPALAAA